MAKSRKEIKESDLYKPIYEYLTGQGYTVRSEVKNCDMAAMKNEELIIIELKKGFNSTLLIQATQRQRAADSVYVAIPKPKGGAFSKSWRQMTHLLRRLELGLITVNFLCDEPEVEIHFHPAPFEPKRNKKLRHSIIREVEGRHSDYNVGGSNKSKLMTAYKENSVFIACCLKEFGPLSPAALRKLGTGTKTQSILLKNFYGWFVKIQKGSYGISPEGEASIACYPELCEHYKGLVTTLVTTACTKNKLFS